MTELMQTLHEAMSKRWRPEDVIYAVMQSPGYKDLPLNDHVRNLFKKAVPRHYAERAASSYWAKMQETSMSRGFASSTDLQKQIDRAKVLWPEHQTFISAVHADNADSVNDLIVYLKRTIAIDCTKQDVDFKKDRLNRAGRKAVRAVSGVATSLPKGHRAYNKRFRFLTRMEKKFNKWLWVREMRDLARVAKSRLAFTITPEEFGKDVVSGIFLAYITARLNMRSKFTNTKQDRAYDTIAEAIFQCIEPETGNFVAMSRVHPAPDVLSHLNQQQLGELLGIWYHQMERAAKILDSASDSNSYNLTEAVVKRGDDSSTWNEAAGAFNKCRDGWIGTLYALGAESVLDGFAPGKVMRLMAHDVVRWHRSTHGGLDPDTIVWQKLPWAWEVVLGRESCNRKMIEDACRDASQDKIKQFETDLEKVKVQEKSRAAELKNSPNKSRRNRYSYGSYYDNYNQFTYHRERLEEQLGKLKASMEGGRGWIRARSKGIEEWRPTPELVHGVEVGSPALALRLRKAGFFSGSSPNSNKVKPHSIDGELLDAAGQVRDNHATKIERR
jgi:hypothetical protein